MPWFKFNKQICVFSQSYPIRKINSWKRWSIHVYVSLIFKSSPYNFYYFLSSRLVLTTTRWRRSLCRRRRAWRCRRRRRCNCTAAWNSGGATFAGTSGRHVFTTTSGRHIFGGRHALEISATGRFGADRRRVDGDVVGTGDVRGLFGGDATRVRIFVFHSLPNTPNTPNARGSYPVCNWRCCFRAAYEFLLVLQTLLFPTVSCLLAFQSSALIECNWYQSWYQFTSWSVPAVWVLLVVPLPCNSPFVVSMSLCQRHCSPMLSFDVFRLMQR